MGKHVLAVVALGLLWISSNVPMAQDKPKGGAGTEYPFVAGRYLTAEDYQHVVAALNYVDLKPADLSFEKKVALNQRFVLPVCAQCLDNPLSVPKVAEDAATTFSKMPGPKDLDHPEFKTGVMATESHVGHFKKVASLLGLSSESWTEEEMNNASPELKKIADEFKESEGKDGKDEATRFQEMQKKQMAAVAPRLFGGEVKLVQEAESNPWPTLAFNLHLVEYGLCLGPMYHSRKEKWADVAGALAASLPRDVFEAEKGISSGHEKLDTELFETASKFDRASLLFSASWARSNMLFEYMKHAKLALEKIQPEKLVGVTSKVKGVSGKVLAVYEGPWGKFVIGGTGDNTYEGDDFIAIIDLGGNDVYRGRVAAGVGLPGHSPFSFVIDCGGDDRYMGEDFTQGFGFNGVGILWDLGAGNDYYKSRFCSQGCGLLGYGELFDDGGDDEYFTDSGSQGAACFGYGHLIDANGNDTYRGARYVQACALVGGVAVLTDGGGNDLYYAGGKYLHVPLHNDHYQSLSQGFSIGNRNDANPSMGTGGGVALLLDQGNGNDNYIADIYGQGSSYWLSLGMQVDEGGNDNHILYQYGLGGGIHLSTGILVDLAGNDSYTDPWGVGLGGAHDYAVGWLIDRAGNDLYQGGGQGQGLNFSFGCLLDVSGNDAHSCPGAGSIGAGHNNDISLLLDLDGDDFYTVPDVKNGRFTRQGNHGLIYDCPSGGWFPGIDASTLPTKQDPAPKKVKVQHILISFDGVPGVKLKNADSRTQAQAQVLAAEVLREARKKGADWSALQEKYNEDTGDVHHTYVAEPKAGLIEEFKTTALSLGVGQIALSAKSQFGWHIIKRVE